jgi:hypothetical protein
VAEVSLFWVWKFTNASVLWVDVFLMINASESHDLWIACEVRKPGHDFGSEDLQAVVGEVEGDWA